MEKDYRKEAQQLAEEYARNFHGPVTSMDDGSANFDLREAADLIAQSRIEKQQILRNIEAQRGTQQALDKQREDVSLLPDREAQRIQSGWTQQAKQQAENYADAVNAGKRWRSCNNDPSNKDIRDGVLSWIKKQKAKRSLYNKN